ncbi:hypothetical protein H4R20_005682 [Coemansia guatemalensis]|uniref:MARVEL domain-containing protein n=1 Tax=Coemansia guatemalensis TaxID=2761395 RepID=A0A9W8HXE4_9FUNG|nr:hypothetical protein H4R20_005682 [Coemansia guatemalensis]
MLGANLLRLLRYSLYLWITFLVVIELIVDAVALAAVNDFDQLDLSGQKGAAGYTMFVTLATLLLIPLISCSMFLVNRGVGFAGKLNLIVTELAVASIFSVLWFIAGVVMAVKSRGDCFGLSVCKKFKAATAFAWLPFFSFLFLTSVLVLIWRIIRSNGGSLSTPTHALDSNMEAGHPSVAAAAPPQHPETSYAPDASKNEGGYYSSNPQVNMPSPAANPQ